MITITATFEIDESKYYFEGKKANDWFSQKIASGDLAATIHFAEVDNVEIITTRTYKGVTTSAKKTIPHYNTLANTIQLKVQ
jgi:hypothetical protein